MSNLRKRVNGLTHQWLDATPKPVVHKPLLQCRSDPNAPPSYWESDPDLHVIRYGPRIERDDLFYCKGGVNAEKLLQLSRKSLYQAAHNSGGNVLLDERWHCTIAKSIVRYPKGFRVHVSYSAVIAEAAGKDPQKVARAEDARGINGLMIVLDRR
ncbi:hypothetical protein P691DRAFT_662424 [Macrolepiota fuliginosa MF-IS2]|uniref:Uncharacterized protein n=1 Tax=Macrolepiota fuliginosa MF-IS2 TaxID=1400762 RepID=A0A9P6C4G7_9AGAR|nr:hypothetical protein P691DRAFT_662424 [Macrolepiota fuliginosa MF-IS2]